MATTQFDPYAPATLLYEHGSAALYRQHGQVWLYLTQPQPMARPASEPLAWLTAKENIDRAIAGR